MLTVLTLCERHETGCKFRLNGLLDVWDHTGSGLIRLKFKYGHYEGYKRRAVVNVMQKVLCSRGVRVS